jgi:hypothetical protein
MSFVDQYAPSWWPAGYAPQDDDTLPPGYFLDPRLWKSQWPPADDPASSSGLSNLPRSSASWS